MVNAQEFFGKEVVSLFHGSSAQVKHPQRGVGNPHNDYGPGFYTTELRELALEWACPSIVDGWATESALDTHGLSVVDLSGPEFTVLNWMAVLLEHRKINVGVGIAGEARGFIIETYGVDLSSADIVHGYRADDSYFHIARSFLNNRIPVEVLEQSLFLGGLGHQVAVVSEAAFESLTWVGAEPARGKTWHPRRAKRDADARAVALQLQADSQQAKSGCYILDIMRGADPWHK